MTSIPFPDADAVFGAASSLAMLGWLALAVLPARARWAGAARVFAGRVVPLMLAVVYGALFARHGLADGGYGSLAEVRRLFAEPELLTAGWLHFLAFDLFVGTWIAERSAGLGLPHPVLLPLLALTLMFGPAGWLAFMALQAVVQRRRPRTAGTAPAVA